jgi:hypothetical protein
MMNLLIVNKSKADFPELLNLLNDSTKVVRILDAGLVVKNVDTATFDIDLRNCLRVNRYDTYLFYNNKPDGHYKVIGTYTANDTLLGIQLWPL